VEDWEPNPKETIWFDAYAGERVRAAISWNSHMDQNDPWQADELKSDLNLTVRDASSNVVDYSCSWDNSYEIVDFIVPTSGWYYFEISASRMDVSFEFVGFAYLRVPTFVTAFESTASDGSLAYGGFGIPYSTIHDAPEALYVFGSEDRLWIGQIAFWGTVCLYRTGLFFDTTSLPDGAVPVQGTLSLFGRYDDSATDFAIHVVRGAPLDDPLVAADYGDLLYEVETRGWLNTAYWVVGAYNDISLLGRGVAEISTIGLTKFGLRSHRDIDYISPSGMECVIADSYEGSGRPRLTVRYMYG